MDMLNMFFGGMIVETSVWCFFCWSRCFQPVFPNSIGTLLLYPITTSPKNKFLNGTYITNEKNVDFFQFLDSVINFTIAIERDVLPSACFHVGGGNTGNGIEACASSRNLTKLCSCFLISLGFSLDNQITRTFGQSWRDGKDRLLNHQL